MSELLAMEGKLAGLKNERFQLEQRIEALCSGMRRNLNTALTPVADLDIPQISQQSRDLELAFVELQSVNNKITRLKRELGHG